tara:strand:+ start:244 stop:489 length:246 start_codon:yes stop_codon:yes gene_type:complete
MADMPKLKAERLRRGLSQTQMAAHANLHTQQISAIENRISVGTQVQRDALARALGIPVKDLFSDIPERVPLIAREQAVGDK